MSYNIGSFNLHNLGLSSLSNNNSRDLSKIATIIRDESFDVVALQEIRSDGKFHIAPKTGLCVYLPDGSFIQEKKACDTFVEAIKIAGVIKVRELGYKFCRVPLVSNTLDAKYGHAQHSVGNGLYVLTHSSTKTKKQQLDRISKALHLNWKVVIVD